MSSINSVCVIWNSLQIAQNEDCVLLGPGGGVDSCRC